MATKSAKEYAFKLLFDFVKVGGKSATPEHAAARKKICDSCPLFGVVEPVPGLKMNGCTQCGCPSATKPHMITLMRAIDKDGQSFTVSEMVELKMKKILGSTEKIEQKIKCPHPDGNKWENVDRQFLN